MHLQAERLPPHRVEKIEPDRELGAKAGVYPLPKQRAGLAQHQVLRRDLHPHLANAQVEAVLFRYAIKAPGIVGLSRVQIAHLLHPLPAPDPGVEEGHHPKRLARRLMQPRQQRLPRHQGRLASGVGIEQEIDGGQLGQFMAVKHPPLDEEGALVAAQYVLLLVAGPPVAQLLAPQSLLDLPAGEIGIDPHISSRHQRSATAHHHHQATGYLCDLLLQARQRGRVKKLHHLVGGQHTKHPVLGDEALQHRQHF